MTVSVTLLLALATCPQEEGWETSIHRLQVEVLEEGVDPRLDVIADNVSAFEILQRVAAESGRVLHLDPSAGEELVPLDVELRGRRLFDVAERVAASTGLRATVDEHRILIEPLEALTESESLLRKALGNYRTALLRNPTSAEATLLRMRIADLNYRLGDYAEAAQEYVQLRLLDPDFPDMPVLLYRLAHAYRRAGDTRRAIETFLLLGDQSDPRTMPELAAPGLLEAAHDLRSLGEDRQARVAVRRLVENWPTPLPPDVLAEAGWLLLELGSPERAGKAFDAALAGKSPSAHEVARSGRCALALRHGTTDEALRAIHEVLENHPNSRLAAELTYELAQIHYELGEHGTALLALRRVPELGPSPTLRDQATLLEGTLWRECGLTERSLALFESLQRSVEPSIALEALDAAAGGALEAGQLHRAGEYLEQLEARFPQERARALLGRAEVAMLRRNRVAARQLASQALDATSDPDLRARILEFVQRLATVSIPPSEPVEDSS